MAKAKNVPTKPEPTEAPTSFAQALVGPLQLRVLHILWSRPNHSGTVADVHGTINGQGRQPLAYTTILTVMRNLARRQVVEQIPGGRQHVFKAKFDQQTFERRLVRAIVDEVFSGDRSRFLASA